MRISHRHRFIWISIPKTGSTSVRKLLNEFSDIVSADKGAFRHHATLSEISEVFKVRKWDISEYAILTTDRNPWEKVASLWKYSRINIRQQKFWEKNFDPNLPRLSFRDFMKFEESWKWLMQRHRMEIYTDRNSRCEIFDIKTEARKLENRISSLVGENFGPLPQLNESTYTDKDLEVICEVFSDSSVDEKMKFVFRESIERYSYSNPFNC